MEAWNPMVDGRAIGSMRFVEYDFLGSAASERLLRCNSLHAPNCESGLNRGKGCAEFQTAQTPGICRIWVLRSYGQSAETTLNRISVEPQLQYLQVTVLAVVEVSRNGQSRGVT